MRSRASQRARWHHARAQPSAFDHLVSDDVLDDTIENQYRGAGADAPSRRFLEDGLVAQAQADGGDVSG